MDIFEIQKKTDYSDSPFNYQVAQSSDGAQFKELTVTITLAEYRELVTKSAAHGADLERMRQRAAEAETKLRQQIEETQALRQALKAAAISKAEG